MTTEHFSGPFSVKFASHPNTKLDSQVKFALIDAVKRQVEVEFVLPEATEVVNFIRDFQRLIGAPGRIEILYTTPEGENVTVTGVRDASCTSHVFEISGSTFGLEQTTSLHATFTWLVK